MARRALRASEPSTAKPRPRLRRTRLATGAFVIATAVLAGLPPPASAYVAEAGSTLAVALGSSLPDVGIAASLTAAEHADAVLLSESVGSLGSAAAQLVSAQSPDHVLIVGGTAAVNAAVESELRQLAPGVAVERLAGTDRIHTAALAATRVLDATDDSRKLSVIIANGWSLPDVGAAASAVAAGLADAVLYSASNNLGDQTQRTLRRFGPAEVLISGGTAAVTSATQTAATVAADGATTRRLGGTTRTHTAALVAQDAYPTPNGALDTLVVADGWSPADVGIAASLAAALTDAAVIYTNKLSLDDTSARFVAAHRPQEVYFVSTQAALTSAARTRIQQLFPASSITYITNPTASSYHALSLTPPEPTAPAQSDPAVSVSDTHGCTLGAAGTIACWGRNDHGQATPPSGTFSDISVGDGYSCAIRTDGTIACWGSKGLHLDRTAPPDGTFTMIAAGPHHPCAIRTDGTIACWGSNGRGYTGGGSTSRPPAGTYADISMSADRGCAIRTDGTIACWGWTAHRYFGTPPDGSHTAIAAGHQHACAIRTDRTVTCWGDNGYGATEGRTQAPKGAFVAIAAGRYHTCALRTDLTVACWGGSTDPIRASIGGRDSSVTGLTDAPSGSHLVIAVAYHRSCTLRADSTTTCWGGAEDDRGSHPAFAVIVSPTAVKLLEGESARYSIKLSVEPAESVTIGVTVPEGYDVHVDRTSFTFNSSNWNAPQFVTVTATQDDDDSNETVRITHAVIDPVVPRGSIAIPSAFALIDDDEFQAPTLALRPPDKPQAVRAEWRGDTLKISWSAPLNDGGVKGYAIDTANFGSTFPDINGRTAPEYVMPYLNRYRVTYWPIGSSRFGDYNTLISDGDGNYTILLDPDVPQCESSVDNGSSTTISNNTTACRYVGSLRFSWADRVRVVAYNDAGYTVSDTVAVPSAQSEIHEEFQRAVAEYVAEYGRHVPWLREVWAYITARQSSPEGGPDGQSTQARQFDRKSFVFLDSYTESGLPGFARSGHEFCEQIALGCSAGSVVSSVPPGDFRISMHELGHIYTLSNDAPANPLAVATGFLYLQHLLESAPGWRPGKEDAFGHPCNASELYADTAEDMVSEIRDQIDPWATLTSRAPWNPYDSAYFIKWRNCDIPGAESLWRSNIATVRATLNGVTPQWYHNTFQQPNGEWDLDALWAAFRALRGSEYTFVVYAFRDEFGGYCTADPQLLHTAYTQGGNPWRDGGCVADNSQ